MRIPGTKPAVRLPKAPDLKAMQDFLATRTARQVKSATEKAQTLIYDAWEKPTPRAQAVHAHKALAASPLCADAFNLLAGHAKSREKALDLYQRGMEAAALLLGPEGFEEYGGEFWGWLESRPYMRARAGVALTLDKLGRGEEAVGHLQAMLKLNPNDNQGMRFALLGVLLNLDAFEAAKALIGEYPGDGSLCWSYGRALIGFQEGRQDEAETLESVRDALIANSHVERILAGKAALVIGRSPCVVSGSAQEASDYVLTHGRAWRKLPGAVDWLIAAASAVKPESSKASSPGSQ
jgi:tetratricopeptide (TPR) repeat protein